jgi:RNA polymerase sigma-70 factor (family 1)
VQFLVESSFRNTALPENERLNLQDPAVFNALFRDNHAGLYYLALRILESPPEAEDVVSESFVKLWNSTQAFPNQAAATVWLRITIRNACLNLLKRHHYQQERLNAYAHQLRNVEHEWHHEDLLGQLLQSIYTEIESLPEQRRAIFKLRYLQHLDNRAIAEHLGIKHQTVRNQLAHALKTLRLSLGPHAGLLHLALLLLVTASSKN